MSYWRNYCLFNAQFLCLQLIIVFIDDLGFTISILSVCPQNPVGLFVSIGQVVLKHFKEMGLAISFSIQF